MFSCTANSNIIFYIKVLVFMFGGSQTANLPPWITSVFESEYYLPVSHSSPLILRCKAQNGIISYQWFKNNVKLQTNDRVVVNGQSGEIIFQNLKKEDFGTYHCVAENRHGSSVSLFLKILEAVLGAFGEVTNKTINCKIFHHCKVPCSNQPNCQPMNDCKFEWKSGKGTEYSIIANENLTIDAEGDLHFLNIDKSQLGHCLSCGIWNEKLKIFSKGTSYTVDIDEDNETANSQAIWKNNPKAIIGGNASLQCIFSGIPVPKIQWLFRNGSITTSNTKYVIKQYGRDLLIRNVTFDDDGVYRCVANGNLTNDPYLNVTSPPIFADSGSRFMMKEIKLSYKEETEIYCHAISAPNESNPIVIHWMKNGRILQEDSSYTFSDDKKRMHVANNDSNTESGGCFTCVVENSEGIAVANFILTTRHSDQEINYINNIAITASSIALVMVMIIGVIIMKKKVISKSNAKYPPEEIAEAEEEPVYSDPVIELYERLYNLRCGEEVSYDSPQLMVN